MNAGESKDRKLLAEILARLLDDSDGEASTAFHMFRQRALACGMTGGTLKNTFLAGTSGQGDSAWRDSAARTEDAAELEAARRRIGELQKANINLSGELEAARRRIGQLQKANTDLSSDEVRRACFEHQRILKRLHTICGLEAINSVLSRRVGQVDSEEKREAQLLSTLEAQLNGARRSAKLNANRAATGATKGLVAGCVGGYLLASLVVQQSAPVTSEVTRDQFNSADQGRSADRGHSADLKPSESQGPPFPVQDVAPSPSREAIPPTAAGSGSINTAAPASARLWPHTTASGVRWRILPGNDPQHAVLYLALQNGQVATVLVASEFLQLSGADMDGRIDHIRDILAVGLGNPSGSYEFRRDGTLHGTSR